MINRRAMTAILGTAAFMLLARPDFAADDAKAPDPVKPADQMVVNGTATVADPAPAKRPRRARRAASRPAGPPEGADTE